jgi:hypothetical protein
MTLSKTALHILASTPSRKPAPRGISPWLSFASGVALAVLLMLAVLW